MCMYIRVLAIRNLQCKNLLLSHHYITIFWTSVGVWAVVLTPNPKSIWLKTQILTLSAALHIMSVLPVLACHKTSTWACSANIKWNTCTIVHCQRKTKWQKAGPLHEKNISQISARNKRSNQCQTQPKLLQSWSKRFDLCTQDPDLLTQLLYWGIGTNIIFKTFF